MFTRQHYREVARILHESRAVAIADDNPAIVGFWYDRVYTPFVKLFEADNKRFDSLAFSWAVATGDYNVKPLRVEREA